MMAPYSLSCLFLLSLGTCFPPAQPQEPPPPGEWTLLGPSGRAAAEDAGPWRAGAERRRSEERSALLSIARELRGHGEEGAGQRAGGQRGSELRAGGERGGALRNLAEELSGYSRRKGGFAFRFGR